MQKSNAAISKILETDRNHVWHPYTSVADPLPVYPVAGAEGCRIILEDGRKLVDGMASWWCCIHGYNHPALNRAAENQLKSMSHVMFGGLTHKPAVELASLLLEVLPSSLKRIFFCDSGSVSVEVAMKMAFQYWIAAGNYEKKRLLTVRCGYHGDTFAAMSVCDPVNGMHNKFENILQRHYFAPAPACGFDRQWDEAFIRDMADIIEANHREIAAVILEPIVQGAGGMRFYSPQYLARVSDLCREFGILLILDEIATGFGRTGRMFACEHAGVSPDIMCLGKALTGGYMTMAATAVTEEVSRVVCSGDHGPGLFMHGPTFMANPLACAVSKASLKLLMEQDWQGRIKQIEAQMKEELEGCREFEAVADVRVLGGIGVVELKEPVDMGKIQQEFVEKGVWIRPFGRLIYIMPPYVIKPRELSMLTRAITEVAGGQG